MPKIGYKEGEMMMINIIWFVLLASGIIVGFINGNIEAVTAAAIGHAESAVAISLGLIGVMALWLGIMKIAEDAGLVSTIAKALRLVMKPLFPEIPENHPAMGAIVMNMGANILGLGNAATPLGINAMKEMQKLNPNKDTATNSMVMFLAINTSSITLIPATVIAIRASAGAMNPTEIIGPTLIATTISTIVAICAVKILQRLPKYQIKGYGGKKR